jgi:muramoyltetrapeptide carboxypeptidase LdcA involved in peptidoglycan recycling
MCGQMDEFTIKYLKHAFFDDDEIELTESKICKDVALDWNDVSNLNKERDVNEDAGWYWNGEQDASGITWGGCLESIDEMLRHNIQLPSLEEFENIVLFFETSEEVPPADYVNRILRALGERGILNSMRGVLVGRPQVWTIERSVNNEQIMQYREEQRMVVQQAIRKYNKSCPIIQNMDFGHTNPQICLPLGTQIQVNSKNKQIKIQF